MVLFILEAVVTFLNPLFHMDFTNFLAVLVTFISGFFISIFLYYLYNIIQIDKLSIINLTLIIIIVSFFIGTLWYWIDIVLSLSIYGITEYSRSLIPLNITNRIIYYSTLIILWSGMYFVIVFWQRWRIQIEKTEKAGLLAQSAQLQMLRYQINPHFLFNSFSSLRALIRTNPNRAEEMISKLSDFFRYSLATRNEKSVSLFEEINAIQYYLDIEKIRFGPKLEYTVTIDPLAEEYPVPGFILHPIIENAIKYGMKTSPMPLRIDLRAEVQDDRLAIRLSNTGSWIAQSDALSNTGTGTGLSNVRKRLDTMYPDHHWFEIKPDDHFVQVFIEIYKEIPPHEHR
jgi:two-component system, LytTR family, sensor kinase